MSVPIISTEDEGFLNKAREWLTEANHMLVEVYVPHSGAGSDLYIVESFEQLQQLIFNARHETFLTLLRGPIFLMQGVVDDDFIKKCCSLFVTKDTYMVIFPCFCPDLYDVLGWGTRAVGLNLLLEELRGKLVWVGEEPFIVAPDDASERHLANYVFAQKL